MRKCEDCKVILDPDVRHCPKCGKLVADQPVTGGAPSPEVAALLTSANLHRMRSEWDDAVSDATEALRRDPRNPDIAALLGGIYEQRGMLEDAQIWYHMAIELNPLNAADRAALERVKQRLVASDPDRLREFQRRTRVWAGAIAALFVGVMLIALIFTMGRSRQRPEPVSQAGPPRSTRSRTYQATPAPPARAPKGMNTSEGEQSEETAGVPSAAGTARTAGEREARARMSSLPAVRGMSLSVDDLIADPREGTVIVTVNLAAAGRVARDDIVTAARYAAKAAFDASRDSQIVTVRVIVTPQAGSPQIVYVGDATWPSTKGGQGLAGGAATEPAFSREWWNPQVGQ